MNLMNAFFGPSLLFMEDIEAKVSPKELILHYSFDKDSIKKKISQISPETKTMVLSKVNKKLLKEKSRKVWSSAGQLQTIFL